MSRFHKNKIYRVKEKTDRGGVTRYQVQATESKWDVFFGIWDDYDKLNNTLDEAIDQIKCIDSVMLVKEKIVHTEER